MKQGENHVMNGPSKNHGKGQGERRADVKVGFSHAAALIATILAAYPAQAQVDRVIGNTANTPVGSIRPETVLVNRDGSAFTGATISGSKSNAGSLPTSSDNLSAVSFNYWWNGANWVQAAGTATGGATVTPFGSAGTALTQGTGAAGANSLNTFIGGGSIGNTGFNALQGGAANASANPFFTQLTAGSAAIGSVSVSNFPATQNVNNAQVSGTAISVNTGAPDAGTQRVVLATGQTQNVNNTQIGGTTISTNSGAADAGTQRVVTPDLVAPTGSPYTVTTAGNTNITVPAGTAKMTDQISGTFSGLQIRYYGSLDGGATLTSLYARVVTSTGPAQFGTSGYVTGDAIDVNTAGFTTIVRSIVQISTGTATIRTLFSKDPAINTLAIINTLTVAPIAATSTSTSSTITTGGSYQSVLSANGSRRGCLVVNKSTTNVMFVSLGASPTDATAVRLPAATATADGGIFSCGAAQGIVVSDQVNVKTATTGDAFLVISQ